MCSSMRWIGAFLLLSLCAGAPAAERLSERPELARFIDEMVERNGWARADVEDWFDRASLRPEIIELMERPAEGLRWHRYRPLFVTPRHAHNGEKFWRRHAGTLARAEREYGVPAQIVVAILGVESRYGASTGRFRVLDALTTLAVLHPRRGGFFRNELEEYLLLAREENWDPLRLKGSYAGAIGDAQFLASSYRRYAVDFDGDRRRDLIGNAADIIGSVANYFYRHGWVAGAPIVSEVEVDAPACLSCFDAAPAASVRIDDLVNCGIRPRDAVATDQVATLVRLENEDGPTYRLGYANFTALTRYNPSQHYAMAVYELSQMILARREAAR